jgi:leucyl/phenylalanyl-tRNA--protein transferase
MGLEDQSAAAPPGTVTLVAIPPHTGQPARGDSKRRRAQDVAMLGSPFGQETSWPRSDLIAVSREFTPELVLAAYRSGVFPMPVRRGLMGWYSPLARGVIPLDALRVSRSLRKMQSRYEIRVDFHFDAVLDRCADPRRAGGWIDDRIRGVYRELHRAGWAHSVEAWTSDGSLAGGLYGVSLGGLFAGESMFHRPDIGRDASKVTLVALVDHIRAADEHDRLLDVQWRTPHLASLGAVEIERREYLARLGRALPLPAPEWARPIRRR